MSEYYIESTTLWAWTNIVISNFVKIHEKQTFVTDCLNLVEYCMFGLDGVVIEQRHMVVVERINKLKMVCVT